MCGIAGIIDFKDSLNVKDIHLMMKTIKHRGPDDEGLYVDGNIALGHVRLSIRDLSKAGHQPMFSCDKRYCIIFNGEIYNHNFLRTELESIAHRNWLGHSDTETLLVAIEQWGLDKPLKKSKGMLQAIERQSKENR